MGDFAARDVPRSVGTRIVSARRPRCPGARGCENPPVPDSLRPSYPPPLLGRRRLLRTSVLALAAGALGAGTLGGSGGIALGGAEEHTPPPPGIGDATSDGVFCHRIHRCRGVIQYKHLRVARQCARQCHALALSSGKIAIRLTNATAGTTGNIIGCCGGKCCVNDLGVSVLMHNIVRNGAAKQLRIMRGDEHALTR